MKKPRLYFLFILVVCLHSCAKDTIVPSAPAPPLFMPTEGGIDCSPLEAESMSLDAFYNPLTDIDHTNAFLRASFWINYFNPTTPKILTFSSSTYLVGKQIDYGDTYTVEGMSFGNFAIPDQTFDNLSDNCYLTLKCCKKGLSLLELTGVENLTIIGNNATVFYRDNLYYGRFSGTGCEPTACDNSPPNCTVANIGAFINMRDCNNICISDLSVYGSSQSINLGCEIDGTFLCSTPPGRGYQLLYTGMFIKNSDNLSVSNVVTSSFGQDGIQISGDGDNHLLENVRCEYNGRQGFSWTGGTNLRVINSHFNYTGWGGVISNPGAGLDIEPVGDICSGGEFINCHFENNRSYAMICDRSQLGFQGVSNINFQGCTFRAPNVGVGGILGDYSPNCIVPFGMQSTSFNDCTIYGNIQNPRGGGASDLLAFNNCTISNEGLNYTFLLKGARPSRHFSFNGCNIHVHTRGLLRFDFESYANYTRDFHGNDFNFYVDELIPSPPYNLNCYDVLAYVWECNLYGNNFIEAGQNPLSNDEFAIHLENQNDIRPYNYTDGNNTFVKFNATQPYVSRIHPIPGASCDKSCTNF